MPATMHWFRRGLRLHDQPALVKSTQIAKETGAKVYPVYVLDPDCYQLLRCSVNRANFLLEALRDLDSQLRVRYSSRLFVVAGKPQDVLPQLWKKWGIAAITTDADQTSEPYALSRDAAVRELAKKNSIQMLEVVTETLRDMASYGDHVPETYGGFTKLWGTMKTPISKEVDTPTLPPFEDKQLLADKTFDIPADACGIPWPTTVSRDQLTPIWNRADMEAAKKKTSRHPGGETEGLARLKQHVVERKQWVREFEKPKTSPNSLGFSTTALSMYIGLGCVSPRRLYWEVDKIYKTGAHAQPPVSLHGQLMWREFNICMARQANRKVPGSWGQMAGNYLCRPMPWKSPTDDAATAAQYAAWRDGKTGYPFVDAIMRQLRQEGFIHHLGRHMVACFLTRGDLWISWEAGARVFEEELLDADYAVNNFNWLWLSCSGFFYQYFRCYSPIAFGKKTDPNGDYIRKYVPELKSFDKKYIYEPWRAPIVDQKKWGCVIGNDYPKPIVAHDVASKANMSKVASAYAAFKDGGGGAKRAAEAADGAGGKKKVKR
ncbi:cryptochrome-2 [Pycnococcus provasolii]|uniref:Cryptochrome-2 n=1 Tax=Pycnococcus provasolii TaxID=41880 RepID=A0A830HHS6_9CHLO|nr:cryptochrome-2 [Pycnococcus provasolii]